MSFIPNTDADRAEMLKAVGAASMEDLFRDVPARHRYPALNLPAPLSEHGALRELERLAALNAASPCSSFLGAGAYGHFIPSVVDFIVSRSEFATAYTPYQPEISQGTLQAIFEYQTLIAGLTGMEVSNASHYDGATAAAEAVVMAANVTGRARRTVLVSAGVHPHYREVIRTYAGAMGIDVRGDQDVEAGLESLSGSCGADTACVVIQNPDFLGRIAAPRDVSAFAEKVHANGALLVVAANPISLGLLEPPGACGADIVVGEGQPLGNPISFGGPYLGFFAFKREYIRKSSGRIAGETQDRDGRRGFVFTLSTREQHIRREKATSNICTNQSLNALAAAVYLAALGPRGLRRVAELCYAKAHYAAEAIGKLPGYAVRPGAFFHEFAFRCPRPVEETNGILRDKYRITGGYDLGGAYPALAGHMLACCTEVNSRADIDGFVEALGAIGAARKSTGQAAGKKRAAPRRKGG